MTRLEFKGDKLSLEQLTLFPMSSSRLHTCRMTENLLHNPLNLKSCVCGDETKVHTRAGPHVDPLPLTINLVVLVSRPLSKTSQKNMDDIIFTTTTLLDSLKTTKNHI